MRRKLLQSLIFLLLITKFAFGQTVAVEKKTEMSPELRKEAVAFLRETSADVGNLRTLENRISFSSEIASLMWFNDEKEARAMYQAVINDFRQLLVQYDAQASGSGIPVETGEILPYAGGEKGEVFQRFYKAMTVRQQIATSLAEHDAPLALEFFTSTGQAVTNPNFRKQLESVDTYFETRLLAQVAEQDPDTALKYGRKALAKGFNYEIIGVLKKIYQKDADKGAAFGEDIVQKLKSGEVSNDKFYYLSSLLSLGEENLKSLNGKPDKKPIFSEQSLRELADALTQQVLKMGDEENFDASGYAAQIEKFSPSGAAQIRQKFTIKNQTKTIIKTGIAAPPPPAVKIETEEDRQKQLMENVQSLGTKPLSKEEREKIVVRARKTINNIKDPNLKLLALSALAAQIAKSGDKELAAQILDEAKNFINLQPKNYEEFLQIWMLTSGYAQIDAQKAFPVLEDAIVRLNETISAFIKVGEFIDARGEFIEGGEVQIGSFGGAMSREMLGTLGSTDQTLRSLATADFARTKDLTNKFDRPEARILAKMLVLRALFGEKKEQTED
ncbi:MAG: hypothetical protein M3033_04050 [Acidobacteriota bacterium]|nr:hypothetical protein [Acidobacteriota bacterium]